MTGVLSYAHVIFGGPWSQIQELLLRPLREGCVVKQARGAARRHVRDHSSRN